MTSQNRRLTMKDNQAKYPQLRFKGFTDPWVQRQVGDFLTESRIPGSNGAISKKLTVKLWGKGVIPKETVTDGSEATKYYVRKAGQFMYGKLDFLHAAFGIVPENLDGYESTLDSPAFDIANLNSTFLMDTVMRKSFYLYQGNIANGSRKAKRIHVDTFSDMPIDVPTLDEQDKIGYFFDQLDNLIAANQRKLDLLKEQKKSYLQKMFPKNGAKVPELRFAGFADAWEERKLQEVLRERNNQQPQSMEYPLVSFTVENGVTPKTDRYEREQLVVGDKSSKKYKVTVLNDIVYNPANLKFGAISRNKYGNAVFSPIYITFLVNNDVTTPGFIEMFVTRNDFIKRALKYQQGTVYERQSVSPTDLLAMNVYLPGKSEQEKIGSFFQQLDETIALHQRKLEKLQELKKGYLQKMFC